MIISSLLCLALTAAAAPPPRLKLGGKKELGGAEEPVQPSCPLRYKHPKSNDPAYHAPAKPKDCDPAAYELYKAKEGADVSFFLKGLVKVLRGGCDELQAYGDDTGDLAAELQGTLNRQSALFEAMLSRRWEIFAANCVGATRVKQP